MNLNLMLDFETLGNKPNCVALSLGAVLFNEIEIIEKQSWIFNLDDQIARGRKIDGSTLLWWQDKSPEARAIFAKCADGLPLSQFTDAFSFFINRAREKVGPFEVEVWGNGATFDVSIIESIYNQLGRPLPWKYYNVRCYRTIKALFGIEKNIPRTGVHHEALADAEYQAMCLMEWLRTLKRKQ